MSETVKCYRVLRDGMRVGESVRDFGDFMPEAATMTTLRSLLSSNVIEECFDEKAAIDAWREEQDARDKRRADALVSGDAYDPDDELDDLDEDDSSEIVEPPPAEKKIVPKRKKVAKKKVTVKKSDKENDNGKRLTEESV